MNASASFTVVSRLGFPAARTFNTAGKGIAFGGAATGLSVADKAILGVAAAHLVTKSCNKERFPTQFTLVEKPVATDNHYATAKV